MSVEKVGSGGVAVYDKENMIFFVSKLKEIGKTFQACVIPFTIK